MLEINNKLGKIREESSKISREVRERTFGFVITAFSLVAGLAWNEAIQSLIRSIFTVGKDSVLAKFIYAVLMTLILVVITIYLSRVFGKEGKDK
ncbi:MAG: DUF5654 family protein [bacterium]|nr:DUF5654 family protein [bacterium]